eukprot:4082424-Lingulodinium_polyedra.AAC.1
MRGRVLSRIGGVVFPAGFSTLAAAIGPLAPGAGGRGGLTDWAGLSKVHARGRKCPRCSAATT